MLLLEFDQVRNTYRCDGFTGESVSRLGTIGVNEIVQRCLERIVLLAKQINPQFIGVHLIVQIVNEIVGR